MAADARSSHAGPFSSLCRDLTDAFAAWAGDGVSADRPVPTWSDARFDGFARRAFRLQYRRNAPYRRFCHSRGVEPADMEGWEEIPPVPTAGFRAMPLVVGSPDEAVLDFRTSGTTDRSGRRGRHLVRAPSLYRASLEAAFLAFVLRPAARETVPRRTPSPDMLALIPPFSEAPHSSLSWMVDALMERFGGGPTVHAATARGVDWSRAREAVDRACDGGRPICILATTLAVAEWVERLEETGRSWQLPAGSVLMDTGGAKGRAGLDRREVISRARARLDLPPGRAVNEFGMTELLSQRYSDPERPGTDWLVGPPWLRSRALDPGTLEELPPGEEGVVCHFDLANAGSVCAVLTEDLGRVRDGRLLYGGRVAGSAPRGCSLATAELLRAQEDHGLRPGGGGDAPAAAGTP